MDYGLPLPHPTIPTTVRRARGTDAVTVRRAWLATLLAGLVLMAAACSSPGAEPGETSSPTPSVRAPSPTPVDPVEAAEQAALAAYGGMWAAYDLAGRAPASNPDDSRLADYAAGDALDGLRTALGRLRDEGLVFEGSYVLLSPTVVELSPADAPAMAKVEDCQDSSAWVVVRADGGGYEDEPGGRRAVFVDVELEDDGVWRVTGFAVRGVGTC